MIGKEEGAGQRIRNNSGIAQISGTFSNKALAIALSAGQGQAVHTHVSFYIFCIFAKAGVPMPISSLQPFCRMDSRAYVTPALLGLRMLKDFWRDPGSQPFASLVCWCLLTAATKTSALRRERHLDINEEQKALIRFHVWSIAIALAISSWCEAQTTMGWSWVCVFSFSVS